MLLEYLQDYTDRVKPLLDQNELYGKVLSDFEKKWDIGNFPGWPVSSLHVLSLFDDISMFPLVFPSFFFFVCFIAERNKQRFDTRWSSSGPFCFFLLGGKSLSSKH